jgi:hypothetical protein
LYDCLLLNNLFYFFYALLFQFYRNTARSPLQMRVRRESCVFHVLVNVRSVALKFCNLDTRENKLMPGMLLCTAWPETIADDLAGRLFTA